MFYQFINNIQLKFAILLMALFVSMSPASAIALDHRTEVFPVLDDKIHQIYSLMQIGVHFPGVTPGVHILSK